MGQTSVSPPVARDLTGPNASQQTVNHSSYIPDNVDNQSNSSIASSLHSNIFGEMKTENTNFVTNDNINNEDKSKKKKKSGQIWPSLFSNSDTKSEEELSDEEEDIEIINDFTSTLSISATIEENNEFIKPYHLIDDEIFDQKVEEEDEETPIILPANIPNNNKNHNRNEKDIDMKMSKTNEWWMKLDDTFIHDIKITPTTDHILNIRNKVLQVIDEYTNEQLLQSLFDILSQDYKYGYGNKNNTEFHHFRTRPISKLLKKAHFQETEFRNASKKIFILSDVCEEDDVQKNLIIDGNKYQTIGDKIHIKWNEIFVNTNEDDCISFTKYICAGRLPLSTFGTRSIPSAQSRFMMGDECLGFHEQRMNSNRKRIDGNTDEMCSLIAFSAHGAHYTTPFECKPSKEEKTECESSIEKIGIFDIKEDENSWSDTKQSRNEEKEEQMLEQCAYINDTLFLGDYRVRNGYETYGACAYFDENYEILAIRTAEKDRLFYRPPEEKILIADENDDETMENFSDFEPLKKSKKLRKKFRVKMDFWEHAKWVWKVSISVATLVCDWMSHLMFVTVNNYMKIVHSKMSNVQNPIHKLLKPFMYGSVTAVHTLNRFLSENGMYHRVLAFEFIELQKLISDSIINYRFKMFNKYFSKLKKTHTNICPMSEDFQFYWEIIHRMVKTYINQHYYKDRFKNESHIKRFDKETDHQIICEIFPKLKPFYDQLLKSFGLTSVKYRFKRYNVVYILTHFICCATAWNKYLLSSFSFECSGGISNYIGLKIKKSNEYQANDVQSYCELCCVIFSLGLRQKNITNASLYESMVFQRNINVDGNVEKRKREIGMESDEDWPIFDKFIEDLRILEQTIQRKNNGRRIPFISCLPSQLQSSCCL